MGSRECFNIFNKMGRQNIRRRRFDKWCRQHILVDSFGWIPCLFKGHKVYENEENEYACKRCHRYVNVYKPPQPWPEPVKGNQKEPGM